MLAARRLLSRTTCRFVQQTGAPRRLNIHEYQCQELMKKFGIDVPEGRVAETPEEAQKIANSLLQSQKRAGRDKSTRGVVIKAQVLAGGRGLGKLSSGLQGGVHVLGEDRAHEVESLAEQMLGHRLITKQTGAKGRPVSRVFVTEKVDAIEREAYFALVLDRKEACAVMVASSEGGMNIEDVAAESPDKIVRLAIDTVEGVTPAQVDEVVRVMQVGDRAAEQVEQLVQMFNQCDCLMLEVNPLVRTAGGEVICLDAKVGFDDNAEFRQRDIFALRDTSQEDEREVHASQFDLNYIALDGDIGCLVNGAGLAMATMDIIEHWGGSAANFLDVGGGADQRQVTEAIKILQDDKAVRAILINIFGGIMRCDVIALGIIEAANEVGLDKPMVIRLEGTNVDEAKRLLAHSGMPFLTADNLDDAAKKVVDVANIHVTEHTQPVVW